MDKNKKWIDYTIELQSLAQAGLTYGKDVYDQERYERIRQLSAMMMADISNKPVEQVEGLFCNEVGYQTPKIDTRAAIFKEDKILLVQEKNGTLSLPGGWCDVNGSVMENTIKEVKEEAGLDVVVKNVIAIQDREKHNQPIYAYKVCKIFMLCEVEGGVFKENSETIGFDYFSDTAHTGGAIWEDAEISSAIKAFVWNGGGLIGVGEPSGHQYQGRYIQLAQVLGVEKETGFTLGYDKYNWDEHPGHFITADCAGEINFGEVQNFAADGIQ